MSKYPNSGALFKNDNRRPDKNDANATGKLVTTCAHCGEETEFWLNAWTKQGDKGPWQSISAKPKEGQAKATPIASEPEFDDSIPF